MNIRHFRNSDLVLDKPNNRIRRLAVFKPSSVLKEKRGCLHEIPAEIGRLAAFRVLPYFAIAIAIAIATAKLTVLALVLPVISFRPRVCTYDPVLLARPSTAHLEVEMADSPNTVEIDQSSKITSLGPCSVVR